jgi:CRISPR/Cas system-associated exonuclease Cas4 (RecB family)
LIAKYDLLVVHEGKAVIFDWKTYHKRPRDEWMAARFQTRVYRTLLVQAGAGLNGGKPFEPENVKMVYWYANNPDEPAQFSYNLAQYKRDWDDLISLINEITHHRVFPLTEDGKKCSFCPFRSYCNRGIEPGEDADMEDEIIEIDINFEQILEIPY